jgi:hypothetical protein
MTGLSFNVLRRAGLACAAAALVASPAVAGVIYSDFGPRGAYDFTNGWSVHGPGAGLGAYAEEAAGFVSPVSGAVRQIDVEAFDYLGSPSLVVSLWTDNSGTPGTELGSWTDNSVPTQQLPYPQPPIVVDVSGVSVVAGQSYFVMLQPGATDTAVTWQDNPTDAPGIFWNNVEGASSTLATEAFSVLGVPEPAAWALMIGGFALTGAALRRRRGVAAAA